MTEDIGKSIDIEKIVEEKLQRTHRMYLLEEESLERDWVFSKNR